MGDTNWAINTARCGLGEKHDGPFYQYLRDRKSKGFSTIMMANWICHRSGVGLSLIDGPKGQDKWQIPARPEIEDEDWVLMLKSD